VKNDLTGITVTFTHAASFSLTKVSAIFFASSRLLQVEKIIKAGMGY
jgi:hypothetical protein